MDRRRREYLEGRRRKLEEMRRDPTEYRRHQMRLRMEQRRKMSFRNPVESKPMNRNKNRKHLNSDQRPSRIRPRRRRKRSKNCATKQPPYQWDKNNSKEAGGHRRNKNNKVGLRTFFQSRGSAGHSGGTH